MMIVIYSSYQILKTSGVFYIGRHRGWVHCYLYFTPFLIWFRFGLKLGLNCLELTGDCEPEAEQLDKADIICTTPEKFDAVTRRLNESGGASFFSEASMG